jgi:hypothetical protein
LENTMNRHLLIALLAPALLPGCRGDCYSNEHPGSCAADEADEAGWGDTAAWSDSAAPDATCDMSADDALGVLEAYCHSCHWQGGSIEGGFNYVIDPERLVETGKVVPGDPDASLILQRMESGSMPPAGVEPRPSDAEIEEVRQWILCDAPEPAGSEERAFIANGTVHEILRDDVESLSEQERPFARYISLVHLYNAGISEDELETYRVGLSKLLNSLSWSPYITNPEPVDGQALLYRVDLRDYRWEASAEEPVDGWEHLLKEYPYAFSYDDSAFETLKAETGSRMPLLHADWLVRAASTPPLYHDLLEVPATQAGWLAQFGVDQLEDVDNLVVARAGFNGSGVSFSNRVIERHDASYGYCWVSYDFAGASGEQNIFQHPLDFDFDGGEAFCTLPNGLQSYFIGDAAGNRLDTAPSQIVADPNRDDGLVTNGLSCMNCHFAGILPKEDQVREYAEQNYTLFPDDLDTIRLLYVEHDEMDALQARDMERFLEAADETGAPRVIETEPIFALADSFDAPLDLDRVAAEVGRSGEDLGARLDALPSPLFEALNHLKDPGQIIERRDFLAIAAPLICFLEGEFDSSAGTCERPDDACGGSGLACLDDQLCLESGDDAGACISCDFGGC